MSSVAEISQVEGCAFSTEELQRFHKYYKYPWTSVSMDTATVSQRIEYFAANVDPAIDVQRLRDWLRTMDAGEPPQANTVYDRFDAYDFAHAPGFNSLLAEVYNTEGASKHELDTRMELAKATYYSEHVEPLNYDEYRAHRDAAAPKPVCPYQHLWDSGTSSSGDGSASDRALDNVWVVDLADYLEQPPSDSGEELLTLAAVGRIHDAIRQAAYSEQYYAIAIVNRNCDSTESEQMRPFLPPLETLPAERQRREVLGALLRLQIELRQLNQAKPVVIFANGPVDASAVGVVLSTADVVTTDKFSVSLAPTHASVQAFPLAALYDWCARLEKPGMAEYIACHPDLVLRSSEWATLGLGQGFIAHRHLGSSIGRILLAASCPPPSTRNALRKAYMAESVYPGPSKISVWNPEIEMYFALLALGHKSLDDVVQSLRELDSPWANRYLAHFGGSLDDVETRVVRLRVAALRAARTLEYSQVLSMEFAVTNAWALDSSVSAEGLIASPVDASLSEILNGSRPPGTAASDIPDECPFAKMYRKNPDRFKHIDLQQIAKHRSVNLQ
ncbi:hypothetical protein GGH95_001143 [Coemansia sp. RSA 1836]|nr:hypothetical protein GGH95_001143 [Coemansia sp. RSA 1836]